MPERRRTKSAEFEVVLQQRRRLADVIGLGAEVVSLEVKTRAPRQNAADVQAFAFDLQKHIVRSHALRR